MTKELSKDFRAGFSDCKTILIAGLEMLLFHCTAEERPGIERAIRDMKDTPIPHFTR